MEKKQATYHKNVTSRMHNQVASNHHMLNKKAIGLEPKLSTATE
jgi:hypothetical protein